LRKFLPYNPEQAFLLPPSVKEVSGENHRCFFLDRLVEQLDLSAMEDDYGKEGRRAYAPALGVKGWLYAYALGITSSRRLAERVREDWAFRWLAGNAEPDYWTLNDFRRRHGQALNDVFTQMVEAARHRRLGTRPLGGAGLASRPPRAATTLEKSPASTHGEETALIPGARGLSTPQGDRRASVRRAQATT
jgi:transposase